MPGDVAELVEQYGARIAPALEAEFPAGGHRFLSDGARYQLRSGGKRLRPALCLLACEGLGGNPDDALPFACASEILHNLFLLHDDIEDGDRLRRNRETLWVRYGIPNAINIGDFMAAKAYLILLQSPVSPAVLAEIVRVFSETYLTTTLGQALDINLRAAPDLTVTRYFEIVSLKTARYLAYNMVGGALVAGAATDVIARLWELGEALGPAFQIQDDLLDMTAGKGRGGEIGCDIREGKPTLFLAHVLGSDAGEEERARLCAVLATPREETTAEDVAWTIALYERTGAIEFARRTAETLAAKADALIEDLPLSNKRVFSEIARYVITRRT
ncbi:MAG TPA: hypothetical protein DCM87_17445 [Planctomycetes bacterium]|nr:hypothetical protein [Planctomycetota bacterium]